MTKKLLTGMENPLFFLEDDSKQTHHTKWTDPHLKYIGHTKDLVGHLKRIEVQEQVLMWDFNLR